MPGSAHSLLRSLVGNTRKLLKRVPVIEHVQPLGQSTVFSTTGAVIVFAWPIWFPQKQVSASLPKIAALAELQALTELNFFCDDSDRCSSDHIMDLMSYVIRASVTSVSTIRSRHAPSEADDLLLSAMPASTIGAHLSLHAYRGEGEMPPVHALAEFISVGFTWLRELASANGGLTSNAAGVEERMKQRMARIFANRSVQLGYAPTNAQIGSGAKSGSDAGHASGRPEPGLGAPFDEVVALFATDVAAGLWDGVMRAMLSSRDRDVRLERYRGKALP